MKTIIKVLTLCILQFSLTYGYGGQPPPPPQFVSLDIEGPPHQPPLLLIDTNRVTMFAKLSFYSPSTVDGNIAVEGTSSIKSSTTDGKNLDWEIPVVAFNGGVSLKLGESQEFFTSFKIDSRKDKISFSGLDFGLSFLINREKDLRTRLDLGLSYLSMDMNTTLLHIDSYYGDTTYISETSNDKGLNPFASLTIQASFDNWIINPFMQVSYCSYTLFNIDRYSKQIYFTTTAFTLAPGITYRLSDNILLVAGGSIFIPSRIEDLSPPGIYSGFVQANFLLW